MTRTKSVSLSYMAHSTIAVKSDAHSLSLSLALDDWTVCKTLLLVLDIKNLGASPDVLTLIMLSIYEWLSQCHWADGVYCCHHMSMG